MRTYHLVCFKWDGRDHYCIWFSNHTTGFLVENRKLIWFASQKELQDYAAKRDILMSGEELELALHRLSDEREVSDAAGCNYFLNIWNMAEDMARSLKLPFYGKRKSVNGIYDKLFGGCNLPEMTPEGEKYIPDWTEEFSVLKKVIDESISIVLNAF